MPATKKTLPAKLSDCIDAALEDIAKLRRQPKKFTINMGTWVNGTGGDPDNTCEVCFAGSSMVCRLGCDPNNGEINPDASQFGAETTRKLLALNMIREGELWDAVEMFYRGKKQELRKFEESWLRHNVEVTDYFDDYSADLYKPWRKDMQRIAVALRQIGL